MGASRFPPGRGRARVRPAVGPYSVTSQNISDFAENVDDRVSNLLVAGTNITLTYNDPANTLTIAAPAAGVSSFNTRTGAVTLTSGDVTSALTFTPYNATNPAGYISAITSGMVTTALGYTPTSVTGLTGTQTVAAFKTGLSIVKADVGLGSVDNTADVNKAVLSATKLATARNIAITGDLAWNVTFDGSAAVTAAGTLATVNANVGSWGSATQVGTFTVNGKGLTTASGNVTITPAVGSITGLGAGVATALAVNVGLTGAFVTFNGALGTPSSGALTNCTFPTLNQNTTGSAATLTTSRNIDGQAFNGSANITVIAPGTHAATSKTTPVDADELPLVDSASSNVLAKLTWANLKATVKAYFDTLYGQLGAANTWTGNQSFTGAAFRHASTTQAARFENTPSLAPTGAAGLGIEIVGSLSGFAIIQAFNRTSAAYGPVAIDGSTISFRPGGTAALRIAGALINAANDAAAATAGVSVGDMYRNGSVLMIRVA